MNYQLSKLLDTQLTPEQENELEQAENLTRRFLTWRIDPEQEDVLETLKDMLDAVAEPDAGPPHQAVKAEMDYPSGDMFGSDAHVWPIDDDAALRA